MKVSLAEPVQYLLPLGDETQTMNTLIGKSISLEHTGVIECVACGRKTRKSFSQGYCYPCFRSLAACDNCIVRPETCHYHEGTCREPAWGETHCMQTHVVYLANSSGIKVGITRAGQLPTRWIDQGAIQALPVMTVESRYHSGLAESVIKTHVSDRTDWRAMLKGNPEPVDLASCWAGLQARARDQLEIKLPGSLISPVNGTGYDDGVDITYPVVRYPEKIKAINLDKDPGVQGTLEGIKGQYLILDCGVINVRKYTGYHLRLST